MYKKIFIIMGLTISPLLYSKQTVDNLSILINHEGFKTTYERNISTKDPDCILGYYYIGVSHFLGCELNIDSLTENMIGRKWTGDKLSVEEIILLLEYDINELENKLQSQFEWFTSKSQNIQFVLINLAFVMGIEELIKSDDFIEAIETDNLDKAIEILKISRLKNHIPKRTQDLIDIIEKEKNE